MQALEIPKISRELVGQDRMITDGVYMDEYISQLNDMFPLDEVLGTKRARILNGSRDTLTRLLSGVPVKAFGTDQILSGILYTSAMVGFW